MKLNSEWLKLRLYSVNFNSEINRWLAGSMMFSILLVLARIFRSGELTFIFLIWNLFLAFVPYYISSFLESNNKWNRNKLKFGLVFVAWLLFIPNSFYILTDLFHLGSPSVPIWFDLALLLSFAWNGLLLGILSVRQVERVFQQLWPKTQEFIFLFPIMCLNALGIYIGRYLRFNSWDVISNPVELLADISKMIFRPIEYRTAWAMISCYALLMSIIYVTIKRIAKSIH